jgi:hypothetical protein
VCSISLQSDRDVATLLKTATAGLRDVSASSLGKRGPHVARSIPRISRQVIPWEHAPRPAPPEKARSVEIVRGPNIIPPPEGRPLPEVLEGRITIVVEDDVSTGDMAPDGALGMSLWSNIPECAKYMFRRQDPAFHDRALEWGGGFIVGGHNYGQGSSRDVLSSLSRNACATSRPSTLPLSSQNPYLTNLSGTNIPSRYAIVRIPCRRS